MAAQSVHDMWMGYKRSIMPANASDVQIIETRRAFYAGVFSMICVMRSDLLEMSDDDGVNYLEKIDRECEGFYNLVKQGEA